MISSLINRYKNLKKRTLLNHFSGHTGNYAFVGVGNHSLSNLYTMIDFYGIPLKYICTKSIASAQLLAQKYQCEATTDYQKIVADADIKGVFISTSPSAHFHLVKQALEAKKQVFVEKPPCLSTDELNRLIAIDTNDTALVGLQKRYSNLFQILKREVKNPIAYHYKYATGAYPEGNPLWDLFIHPLDAVCFLFGAVKSIHKTGSKGTLFLNLTHESGVIGSLELSTDYTWDTASEELSINTPKGVFSSKSIFDLSFTPKKPIVLGIPVEKVLKSPSPQLSLIRNNGFVPIMENNSLQLQGYALEVKTFIDLVEGKKVKNQSRLIDLKNTYSLIEMIQKG